MGATGSASAGTIGEFPSGTSTGRASGTLSQQAVWSIFERFQLDVSEMNLGTFRLKENSALGQLRARVMVRTP